MQFAGDRMKTSVLAVVIALFAVFPSFTPTVAAEGALTMHFFWGEGCPHCEEARPFLADLQKRYPELAVRSFEVFDNEENLELLKRMAREHGVEARGVPMIFVGGRVFSGFSREIGRNIEAQVQLSLGRARPSPFPDAAQLKLPFFGALDASRLSLPVFTAVIAGLDSFNPCAFFVLFFLLSLLIHAHSRRKMAIIGGIFILCSAVVYFLFMTAWLNLFLLFGGVRVVTAIAGGVALVIALINIKDFFFFKKGISLSLPERAKPRLFGRMKTMLHVSSLPGMIAATVVLSVMANAYEVLCTAGFPMIYTRALTLLHLPTTVYYLYLLLYNVIYIVPLACIVLFFVVTLGSRKISEWQGRVLKLLSGIMMLGLALVLLTRPSLLNNALLSVGLLLLTIVLTAVVATAARHFGVGGPGRH